jgi:hypothetical protein
MELGGPVWHASAAPLPGWPVGEQSLRRFALEALEGVGDADLGEWEEWTGYAFHIRRRLSAEEQEPIGEVVDIRGTPEAHRRLQRVTKYVLRSPEGLRILREEGAERAV